MEGHRCRLYCCLLSCAATANARCSLLPPSPAALLPSPQVQKIRLLLRQRGLGAIRVGEQGPGCCLPVVALRLRAPASAVPPASQPASLHRRCLRQARPAARGALLSCSAGSQAFCWIAFLRCPAAVWHRGRLPGPGGALHLHQHHAEVRSVHAVHAVPECVQVALLTSW